MIIKKGSVQTISVSGLENEDLIKMIEKMDGVKIKRTSNGIRISIHKKSMSKLSVGIVIKKKRKKGAKIGYLTPVDAVQEKQKTSVSCRQSSAIIAKQFG